VKVTCFVLCLGILSINAVMNQGKEADLTFVHSIYS